MKFDQVMIFMVLPLLVISAIVNIVDYCSCDCSRVDKYTTVILDNKVDEELKKRISGLEIQDKVIK